MVLLGMLATLEIDQVIHAASRRPDRQALRSLVLSAES